MKSAALTTRMTSWAVLRLPLQVSGRKLRRRPLQKGWPRREHSNKQKRIRRRRPSWTAKSLDWNRRSRPGQATNLRRKGRLVGLPRLRLRLVLPSQSQSLGASTDRSSQRQLEAKAKRQRRKTCSPATIARCRSASQRLILWSPKQGLSGTSLMEKVTGVFFA